jgi:hypothetical protein
VVIWNAYLLLPMASIAEAGGPMKVIPASVHFFAKCGFSLSYVLLANLWQTAGLGWIVQIHNPDVCPGNLDP